MLEKLLRSQVYVSGTRLPEHEFQLQHLLFRYNNLGQIVQLLCLCFLINIVILNNFYFMSFLGESRQHKSSSQNFAVHISYTPKAIIIVISNIIFLNYLLRCTLWQSTDTLFKYEANICIGLQNFQIVFSYVHQHKAWSMQTYVSYADIGYITLQKSGPMLPEYDSYLPAQVLTHKGMIVVSIPWLSHGSLTQEQSTDT